MGNTRYATRMGLVWFVLGAVLIAGQGYAQLTPLRGGNRTPAATRGTTRGAAAGAEAAETDGKVKIERFPAPGKAAMIRTPEYNANVAGLQPALSSKKREWALFEIKYSTAATWTDELAFTYHVLTSGKDDKGKNAFSYFTTTVRYVDIPKGDHMSCVALPPSLVERYGTPVALALEIVGKNDVLDSRSETSGITLGKEWWKDSKVMDNPALTRRNGLVDRSKTPFALINPNDYEVIQ
ncbi:MAG: hypothetical protein J6334_10340 [Kiritimatiellae bacterium]|nr:hypothetical protein [Kiritimatiellia bacterium]